MSTLVVVSALFYRGYLVIAGATLFFKLYNGKHTS